MTTQSNPPATTTLIKKKKHNEISRAYLEIFFTRETKVATVTIILPFLLLAHMGHTLCSWLRKIIEKCLYFLCCEAGI